jgi:molybdopterin-guanine dinucleotide biosynthesis protein A
LHNISPSVTFTVAIIAGGKSSRMGTDKSFVVLDGKPLIEHVLSHVADLGQDETILITNRPDDYAHLNLPMYGDVIPEKGSLGGIYTAIHYSRSLYTQVIACDTPFVKPDLLRHLLALRAAPDGPFDVIVPRVKAYPQGLHGLYSKDCLAPIRERIDADRLHVIGFYTKVRLRYVDEEEYAPFDPIGVSFFNINTPEELAQAHRIAAGEPYTPADSES